MNAPTYTTVKLHKARMEQIRQIAKAREMTIADLFADWINREIEAGTITADLPEVVIELKSSGVGITMREAMMNPDTDEARRFAARLREIADGHLARHKRKFGEIFRNGPGVVFQDPHGHRFSASARMAHEVADQIDRTLNEQNNGTA